MPRKWVVALVAGGIVLAAVTVAINWAAEDSPGRPVPGCSFYVSTDGSDDAAGSTDRPWRTIAAALSKLGSGETLCVRAGTYDERVTAAAPPQGKAEPRITLRGVGGDGERPVIRGGLSLVDPDYWTISGLRITGPPPDDRHALVSIVGGTGWV